MLVAGKSQRSVWLKPDEPQVVQIINQRRLPWRLEITDLRSVNDVATAIQEGWVCGAGCLGATAGYGMWLATLEAMQDPDFALGARMGARKLIHAGPSTAHMAYAVNRVLSAVQCSRTEQQALQAACAEAEAIADEDVASCEAIGAHGLPLIEALCSTKPPGEAVQILTVGNVGALASVAIGSATAPIYAAHEKGLPVHVWVAETRPCHQGARLTAWELAQHGVPHTVITDSAIGPLLQRGRVDLAITGADRITRRGEVLSTVGTYLQALAAKDNGVAFYVAAPSSAIAWELHDGFTEMPLEEHGAPEVTWIHGQTADGHFHTVRVVPAPSPVAHYASDITRAALITGLITERGLCEATELALGRMFGK